MKMWTVIAFRSLVMVVVSFSFLINAIIRQKVYNFITFTRHESSGHREATLNILRELLRGYYVGVTRNALRARYVHVKNLGQRPQIYSWKDLQTRSRVRNRGRGGLARPRC